jgi:glutathionyl-hydroquinone reductase
MADVRVAVPRMTIQKGLTAVVQKTSHTKFSSEKFSDDKGHFKRTESHFRHEVSDSEGSRFPPEKDRCVLEKRRT